MCLPQLILYSFYTYVVNYFLGTFKEELQALRCSLLQTPIGGHASGLPPVWRATIGASCSANFGSKTPADQPFLCCYETLLLVNLLMFWWFSFVVL